MREELKMKTLVVMNKQHSLLPEQQALLDNKFIWEFLYVPAEGWTLQEQQQIAKDLVDQSASVVFVSPVPVLLGLLSASGVDVHIFHNDKREKRELPNRKVIFAVAQTGWEIVSISDIDSFKLKEAVEGIKVVEFNDKMGNRDRVCNIAVVHDNIVYNQTEAEEKNLAVFQRLDSEKAGKYSNSTWRVTTKTASLVVFMRPFDGWPDDKDQVIKHIQNSCKNYTGYAPTAEECWLAFGYLYPKTKEKIENKSERGWTLL